MRNQKRKPYVFDLVPLRVSCAHIVWHEVLIVAIKSDGAKFQSAFDEARKIAALSTGLGDLSFGHDDEDDDDTTTASEDENEDSPVKKVETESAQSTQGTEDSTQAELQSPTEPNVDPLVDQNKSSPIKVNPDDTPAANDSTPAQEFNGSTQDDVETRDDSNKPPLTE